MDKSAMIRGAILAMQVENKVKTELFEYLDEIEEKASMYDGLCDYAWGNKIKAKIEEIKHYKDLARDSIEEKIVIADSDSLNYGRKEAHEKDIEVLQSLLEKE